MTNESNQQTKRSPDSDGQLALPMRIATEIDGGRVLFWSMIIISGYMFLTAQQFSSEVRLFPQLAAGIVLTAGILKATTAVLNRRFEFDFTQYAEQENTTETGLGTAGGDEETDESEPLAPVFVLGTLITGYIIAGYFVGLFWVTPLFVVAYMRYRQQTWLRTVVLTVVLTAVAYGFMIVMNLDIATGAA